MKKLEECAREAEAEFTQWSTVNKHTWPAVARAVIRCLMTPSDIMMEACAGVDPMYDDPLPNGEDYLEAMLQAVLDEGETK